MFSENGFQVDNKPQWNNSNTKVTVWMGGARVKPYIALSLDTLTVFGRVEGMGKESHFEVQYTSFHTSIIQNNPVELHFKHILLIAMTTRKAFHCKPTLQHQTDIPWLVPIFSIGQSISLFPFIENRSWRDVTCVVYAFWFATSGNLFKLFFISPCDVTWIGAAKRVINSSLIDFVWIFALIQNLLSMENMQKWNFE